jgi:hypothetical protein
MKKKIAAAALAWWLPLYAWGPEGHNLVARIADAQLTPAARAKVAEILGPGVTMASVSSWADSVRRDRPDTGPWHYVDIPIDKKHLDMARDCLKDQCVIKAIENFEAVLRDPNAPREKRKEALMFVIHFVGDMHQPLHSSDNKDKGGNDTHVAYNGRQTNLHSLWDGLMLQRIGTEDALFAGMSAESMKHKKKWSRGSVENWAEQAHKDAVSITYGKLPKSADGKPAVITPQYEAAADPLIRTQIEKAGARLARVLNENLK